MDIQQLWEKALKQTEIIRMRLQDLSTFDATKVPYIFLGESSLNQGDTVIRRGSVLIEKPAIVLPGFSPQFEGFSFDKDLHVTDNDVVTFLLVRGVSFPSLKYRHITSSLDVLEQPLQKAADEFTEKLKCAEDIKTGLIIGPEDAWQFSLLILMGALVNRSAGGDIRRILEDWRKRQQS